MDIYAFANQKGGVGKTTVTLGIAAALARSGVGVVGVDLDPQSSATRVVDVDVAERVTVADAMLEPERFSLHDMTRARRVLLEGAEVAIILSALVSGQDATPVLIGGGAAVVLVALAGVLARKPLTALPETELKLGVGIALGAFGVFFVAQGLGVRWPGDDAALLYLAAAFASLAAELVTALGSREAAA